jgi:hypothetical protein
MKSDHLSPNGYKSQEFKAQEYNNSSVGQKKLICDRNGRKRSFNSIAKLNSHIKTVHSHRSH